jgi:hypothetical protein
MQHVAIRNESYVAGTRERPEVGVLTQTHATRHPVPWGRLSLGDVVWMKWSGGPFVARARVSGFRQMDECTADALRNTTKGFALNELTDYWNTRPSVFSALTVYLENEQWLDEPFYPGTRSRGSSWVVLDSEGLEREWLTAGSDPADSRVLDRSTGKGRSRTLRASIRFEVLRRDEYTCRYCGRRAPNVRLHVDHKLAWSRGGSDDFDNLVTACADCNLGKGARSVG